MTEDRKDQLREVLPVAAIVLCIIIGVALFLCSSGCASPVMASRNVSVYINGGTNTLWITSEPAGGASVLSGIPTNAIEAVARGAAMGVTAVK